jgi:hypothetical protein
VKGKEEAIRLYEVFNADPFASLIMPAYSEWSVTP